jgi:hypothetical protein
MTIDRINRTLLMEHLALSSELDLQAFCGRLQKILDLPVFIYDHENRTEWGFIEVENIEYNVSRPYEPGTLREWDGTVPLGCNFGISLILYREPPHSHSHEWAFNNLVVPIGQKIADEFQNRCLLPLHLAWCWQQRRTK